VGSNKKKKISKRPAIDDRVAGQINDKKQPHSQYSQPISYDLLYPTWSFKRMERESNWVFVPDELIAHENECLDSKCVLSKLAHFERMTWREIKQQQHGKSGKSSSHFINDLSKLHSVAQERLSALQITENLFSLRLEGPVRIFGVLQSQTLEILWYDNKHEIYPQEK
jgi:hypothetical protein